MKILLHLQQGKSSKNSSLDSPQKVIDLWKEHRKNIKSVKSRNVFEKIAGGLPLEMKDKKILIVDDDRIVLDSCERILEAENFKILLVSSAMEAIQLLETEYFDLMIMDVKMPEKDGMYILDKIREKWPLEYWPELPVLVMTGYPTPQTIEELRKKGARDFIPKPFTPDELLQSVKKALKRSHKHGKTKSTGN
jgi:DNA-binding NtrC family response regulator